MVINYPDVESFYDGIKELVKRGLTFTADLDRLFIKLNGGF
jgi:hypothetical protein